MEYATKIFLYLIPFCLSALYFASSVRTSTVAFIRVSSGCLSFPVLNLNLKRQVKSVTKLLLLDFSCRMKKPIAKR